MRNVLHSNAFGYSFDTIVGVANETKPNEAHDYYVAAHEAMQIARRARAEYLGKAITDGFRSVYNFVAGQVIANRTQKALNDLTDVELNDIGMSRGEIYDYAHRNDPLRGDAIAAYVAGTFGAVTGYFTKKMAVRRTEAALMRLTDAELSDIGLTRSEIHDIARRVMFENNLGAETHVEEKTALKAANCDNVGMAQQAA